MVVCKDLCYRQPAHKSTHSPWIAPHAPANIEGKFVAPGLPVFGNQCSIRFGVCPTLAGSPGLLRQPHIYPRASAARA
jgi:hypothetical protein